MLASLSAAFVVLLCVALLLRLCLPHAHRRRLDAGARRLWGRLRQAAVRVRGWPSARRAARDAIRRASGRQEGDRSGKVVHPDAFKRPRKPH